ncbi:MAG: hypothetical protein ACLFWB_09355, partial [Armatimonadota bacterium]
MNSQQQGSVGKRVLQRSSDGAGSDEQVLNTGRAETNTRRSIEQMNPFLPPSLVLYYHQTAGRSDKRGNRGMRKSEKASAMFRNVGIIVIISLAVIFA